MSECLEWHCRQIWLWTSMSLMSARLVSIGCGNCDVCGRHWSLRVSGDARSWLSHVQHRLLQRTAGWAPGEPKATADKSQRLLNAATRLISCTRKFDHGLSQLCMSTFVGWTYRSEWHASSCRWCITASKAPRYPKDYWTPASDIAARRRLCSVSRHQLVVPQHNLNTCGRRPSLLWVRLSGTHWATNCAIWRSAQTVLDGYSKLVCFRSTSTFSEFEALDRGYM